MTHRGTLFIPNVFKIFHSFQNGHVREGHADLMTFVHDLMFSFEMRKIVVMPIQQFMLSTEAVSKQIRLNYSAVMYFKRVHK
jgi:hypothetical protein